MRCPKCQNSDTKVAETRDADVASTVRRRRECLSGKCTYRFTTYERIEMPRLSVTKKDGTLEAFDRDKIKSGISKAVEKRPVTPAQVEKAVSDIEQLLFERGVDEVPSQTIGELVMDSLLQLDDVAYVRFASVYRQFKDVASFEKELAKLRKVRHATN
ncbi:transcriptional repressor NrdR [Candidatus Microgenomates bacterium]|nr:transcriptional repressor NrdR [Candidatus Microgenomates bacterium]